MALVKMPTFRPGQTVGTVVKWLVMPGDRLPAGGVLAEIDDGGKVIRPWRAGHPMSIDRLLVDEGEEVACGTPLAEVTARTPGAQGEPVAVAQVQGVEVESDVAGTGEGELIDDPAVVLPAREGDTPLPE